MALITVHLQQLSTKEPLIRWEIRAHVQAHIRQKGDICVCFCYFIGAVLSCMLVFFRTIRHRIRRELAYHLMLTTKEIMNTHKEGLQTTAHGTIMYSMVIYATPGKPKYDSSALRSKHFVRFVFSLCWYAKWNTTKPVVSFIMVVGFKNNDVVERRTFEGILFVGHFYIIMPR